MLSFFPLDVRDEIWDVTESVSEEFLTYSSVFKNIMTVVVLLFYVHGKHLMSCRDGQLT